MVRVVLIAAILLPVLAGCSQPDMFGLPADLGSGYDGCCGSGDVDLDAGYSLVRGAVSMGELPAIPGEGVALLYSPGDTLSVLQELPLEHGGYALRVYESETSVCELMIRVERWDGVRSGIVPLFASPPSPCVPANGLPAGSSIDLPAYGVLDEPFVIEGTVYVDGRRATEGEVVVELLHRSVDGPARTSLGTDADGSYRFDVRDRGVWLGLCLGVGVWARASDREPIPATLARRAPERCDQGRRLPDVRFGSLKAVSGRVYRVGAPSLEAGPVGTGEAWVQLLSPDQTPVGEPAVTLDDGSYHLWFPQGWEDPGCRWWIRLTLATGETEDRYFGGSDPAASCAYGQSHDFFVG